MYPFPDTLFGNIAAVALLVLLGLVSVVFILKGGLRHQRRKDERADAKKRKTADDQVDRLLVGLGTKGEGLQVVHHSSDGEAVDLTDEELQRGVDGVLKKHGPIS